MEIEKRFVGKKTQTRVRLSGSGRKTVEGYWKKMEELRQSAAAWQAEGAALVPSPG